MLTASLAPGKITKGAATGGSDKPFGILVAEVTAPNGLEKKGVAIVRARR